jgi:hypothetical protein
MRARAIAGLAGLAVAIGAPASLAQAPGPLPPPAIPEPPPPQPPPPGGEVETYVLPSLRLDPTGLGDQRTVFAPTVPGCYTSVGVAAVGDIDGDGLEDLALRTHGGAGAAVWVTFSESGLPVARDAGAPGWRGMRIVGAEPGFGLWPAGDANADGLADVALHDGQAIAVVYGRRDGGTVDLAALGEGGFRIRGAYAIRRSGAGRTCGAAVDNAPVVAAAGDLDGDGRGDLAVADEDSVKVVHSPPPGTDRDADELDRDGSAVTLPPTSGGALLQWLDERLLVSWNDAGGGHVVAVPPAAAGETVAAEGRGFSLGVPGGQIETAIPIGDQNGDGRSDLALVWSGDEGRELAVAFAPQDGEQRTVPFADPAHGTGAEAVNPWIADAGDQDGDGRADIASDDRLLFAAGPGGAMRHRNRLGYTSYLGTDGLIVATLADRNGDGRREIVSLRRGADGAWLLDTHLSEAPPTVQAVEGPRITRGYLRFSGTFGTGWRGGRPLEAAAAVEITGPGGRRAFRSPVVRAGSASSRFTVRVPARRFLRGPRYRFRMAVQNSGGVPGASARRSFVLRGVNRLRGMRGRDRVRGTRWRDRIDARDRARDVVDCGRGRDVALVDPRDVVRRCERVVRAR